MSISFSSTSLFRSKNLFVYSLLVFVNQIREYQEKVKYAFFSANNKVPIHSVQEMFVMQLFFFSLSAAYMNRPHSAGGPQNTPALETGGHPFACPQPALSTVSELSRVCSLVGMSQPDFSFLKTPQVKSFFCKS